MDSFDYHYNGIDLFYNSQTKQQAMKNIAKLITDLYKVKDQLDARSVYLKVFFDAKAGEIAGYLKSFPNKQELVNMMVKIDPAHTSKYEDALSKE